MAIASSKPRLVARVRDGRDVVQESRQRGGQLVFNAKKLPQKQLIKRRPRNPTPDSSSIALIGPDFSSNLQAEAEASCP